VFDGQGNYVALAVDEQYAAQIVADRRAVVLLVAALEAAKNHIGRKPQAPALMPQIDAALAAASGKQVEGQR
jgi:hypothetical protein